MVSHMPSAPTELSAPVVAAAQGRDDEGSLRLWPFIESMGVAGGRELRPRSVRGRRENTPLRAELVERGHERVLHAGVPI